MSKQDPFTVAARKITDRVFAAKAEQLQAPDQDDYVLVHRSNVCLYPGCNNTKRTRGLCHPHYQNARSYIRAGKVTEDELEARGLLTPKGTGSAKINGSRLLLGEPTT